MFLIVLACFILTGQTGQAMTGQGMAGCDVMEDTWLSG